MAGEWGEGGPYDFSVNEESSQGKKKFDFKKPFVKVVKFVWQYNGTGHDMFAKINGKCSLTRVLIPAAALTVMEVPYWDIIANKDARLLQKTES